MPSLNMLAVINGPSGEPIKKTRQVQLPNGDVAHVETEEVVTLRDVVVTALTTPGPRYVEEPQEEKNRRGLLAVQAFSSAVLDVTVEDAAMLKRLVSVGYQPVIVYRASLALEGKDMNPEAPKAAAA